MHIRMTLGGVLGVAAALVLHQHYFPEPLSRSSVAAGFVLVFFGLWAGMTLGVILRRR